jgi:hypothetical protein
MRSIDENAFCRKALSVNMPTEPTAACQDFKMLNIKVRMDLPPETTSPRLISLA